MTAEAGGDRFTICPDCGQEWFVASNGGQPLAVLREPVAGGELVLRGDPETVQPDEFVAAFFGVGAEGDEFWGIPAGAPRYQRHPVFCRPRA